MNTEHMEKIFIEVPDKVLFASMQDKVGTKLIKRILANIEPIVIVNKVLYIGISEELKSDENKLASFRKAYKENKVEVYRILQLNFGISGMKSVKSIDLENLRFLYKLQKKFGGDLYIENKGVNNA